MNNTDSGRRPHPDLIAGIAIIAVAGFLLLRTPDMPTMSAVLPISMLSALIGLAVLMILRTLIATKSERVKAPRHKIFDAWPRFVGVIIAIGLYVGSVSLIGFYTSTAVMVPVVAWCFGYRDIKRLLLADLIFTGGLAVIFVLLMGQDLPTEFFIR